MAVDMPSYIMGKIKGTVSEKGVVEISSEDYEFVDANNDGNVVIKLKEVSANNG